MYKVGITGGMGSGKTTIAKIWEKMGAYVLYADDFAKKLMVDNEAIVREIKNVFGEKAYHTDGSLNRPFLAKEAFEHDRVEELNNIVHPHLFEQSARKMDEVQQQGYKVFVKEAALLFRCGRPDYLDKVVLVLADEVNMMKRAAERDDVAPEVIKKRMEKQQNFYELKPKADFVIYNNGTLEDLEMRARILFEKFVERA